MVTGKQHTLCKESLRQLTVLYLLLLVVILKYTNLIYDEPDPI